MFREPTLGQHSFRDEPCREVLAFRVPVIVPVTVVKAIGPRLTKRAGA